MPKVDPYSPQLKKLKGFPRLFRAKVGKYRVIFSIDRRTNMIYIYLISHRKKVYQKLKRRM